MNAHFVTELDFHVPSGSLRVILGSELVWRDRARTIRVAGFDRLGVVSVDQVRTVVQGALDELPEDEGSALSPGYTRFMSDWYVDPAALLGLGFFRSSVSFFTLVAWERE